jgi:hypothetical protein
LSLATFDEASEKTLPAPVTSAAAELSAAASPGAGSKPSAGNFADRHLTLPSTVSRGSWTRGAGRYIIIDRYAAIDRIGVV